MQTIDSAILLWINGHYAYWSDSLMWVVSQTMTWIPLYGLMLGLIVWKYRNWKPVVLILLGFVVAVGLSDFIASGILKPLVCRLRPTHEPALDPIHLVKGYTGGLYGFCSSHAANTMSCALLFSLLWRNKIATTGLMTWVALVSYSRVYIGVHYPSDVIAGWLVGALLAVLGYRAVTHWLRVDGEVVQQGGS